MGLNSAVMVLIILTCSRKINRQAEALRKNIYHKMINLEVS